MRRFWRHASVSPDGCWLWLGYRDRKGYGRLNIRGVPVLAHRFSWRLHHGSDPGSLLVLHHCDTPACINPEHLFLGTAADNTADMIAKGRGRWKASYGDDNPSRLYPDRVPRGTRNGKAKLTADQVRAMRSRYAFRRVTYKQLAAEYGLTYAQTWKVVNRRAYLDVTD